MIIFRKTNIFFILCSKTKLDLGDYVVGVLSSWLLHFSAAIQNIRVIFSVLTRFYFKNHDLANNFPLQ